MASSPLVLARRFRLKHHNLKTGDAVNFSSTLRPDHIPAHVDPHGVIIATGAWSVVVRFNAFPDEPLLLGASEVRRAVGTMPRTIKRSQKVDKSLWLEWK